MLQNTAFGTLELKRLQLLKIRFHMLLYNLSRRLVKTQIGGIKVIMMKKIQRFGGAMFTPTLLFAFAGIAVGFSILFQNTEIMGSLANKDGNWYKVWDVIASGSWAVFMQLPLLFVIGLPVGLAKKQNARACLEALVTYLTFNYFLSSILKYWGPNFGVDMDAAVGSSSGLAMIAGIKRYRNDGCINYSRNCSLYS